MERCSSGAPACQPRFAAVNGYLWPPVRIGIMGCADIALRRMLPAFAACPGTTVAAVASRDGDKARKVAAAYGCRAWTGYQALLEDPDLEAVYIPLPLALHADWIERSLLAGKHVLGEKPLSCDPATTGRLLMLARSRGLVLAENVMFVHHRQHQSVRDLIGDGVIGEVRAVTAVFAIPPPPPGDIRYKQDLGGGALMDIGIHPLLLSQRFLGPETSVAGSALRFHPVCGVDTGGAVLLTAPDGRTAQVAFGMEHSYRSAYEVWGSAGRIILERAYAPPASHRPVVRVETAAGAEDIVLAADDQYGNAVAAFASAVRSGVPESSGNQPLELARLLADVLAAVPA